MLRLKSFKVKFCSVVLGCTVIASVSPQKGRQSPGHNPLSGLQCSLTKFVCQVANVDLDIISVCGSIPIEIPILWPRAVMVGPRPRAVMVGPRPRVVMVGPRPRVLLTLPLVITMPSVWISEYK